MNEVPPSQDDDDKALDLYRRASALDASRPSESVRRSVLEMAARLATERAATAQSAAEAERAARDVASKIDVTQPAANQPWRRPAIFGTLAAAALAGLLIAPHFLPPRDTHTAAMSARVARSEAPSSPAAAAPPAASTSASGSTSAPEPTSAPAPVPPPAPAAQFAEQSRAADSAPPAMLADEPHPARAPAEAASLDKMSKMSLTARNSAAADAAADAARVSSAEFAANSARAKSQDMAGEGSAGAAARSDAESKASSEYTEITVTGARRAARLPANDAVVPAPPPVVASAPAAAAAQPAARAPRASQSAGLMAGTGKTVPDAALRRAAEIGDVPELQALLDKKFAINARDESGRTALMLATLNGQGDAVDVLLSHGADPNVADAHGTTPLQAALAGNHAEIAAALQRAKTR